MTTVHNFGLVSSPQVRADTEIEKTYVLSFSQADGERIRVRISQGVAQSLWHKLSKHLFPHAADNLTGRAFTAEMEPISDDRDMGVAVVVESAEGGVIQLTIFNGDGDELVARFINSDGEMIWERLEDLFNMMHSGRDHYRHK